MKTGFIGLGAMGIPMAYHLHKQGYLISVWNRTASKAATFANETGILHATDLADLAKNCRLIITCVSRDEDIKQVINNLQPYLQPNTILIDTSTINPKTACELATELDKQQVEFLDGPVTGGVEGAKNGRLAMMVGGNKNTLDEIQPILASFTSRIEYMGKHGQGQAAKAVNQLMAAGINQAVCDSLAFAESLGLPLQKTIDVIASGAAGNWFLSHRGKSMTEGHFEPGFKVALHHKDLAICQSIASQLNLDLPIADATLDAYKYLMDLGFGDEDISALYRIKKPSGGSDN